MSDYTDVEEAQKGEYRMLARLKSDCEYVTKTGHHEKHLWAGNVEDQITEMKRLHDVLEIKPEWLKMEDIERYHSQMKGLQEQGLMESSAVDYEMTR